VQKLFQADVFSEIIHGKNRGNAVSGPSRTNTRSTQPCSAPVVCIDSAQQTMPANPDPDAALMLRVRQGDTAAFAELVDKYKQPVMNVAYRMLRDMTEAEDLAQNVFVQVHKSAHRYEISARFSTWLFTIARNLCLNEIRRRSRHPAQSLDAPRVEHEDQPAPQFEDHKAASPPGSLLHEELLAKVEQAIQSLPENQRIALLLCREEELSYEEIAKVLGCSLSATKSLIHRGRETLKQQLKPYLRSGAWLEK
jgi:RNA polymerase sigma-70 factor, ECF subfamily